MRILWLCNIMLPMIAKQFHIEASNKEGWLSGLADAVLTRDREDGMELAVAFPVSGDLEGAERAIHGGRPVYKGTAEKDGAVLRWYAFYEDVANPHIYDEGLEPAMDYIIRDFEPDVVHCFGTEYPHTLAMCRVFPDKNRILVGIQGLCGPYSERYLSGLPKRVVRSVTLRDFLKKDNLLQQRHKFVLRGEMEREALKLAGNVTGRTAWDKENTERLNGNACYFKMNETLRPNFYTGRWNEKECEPYSIFVSQGDYPIKGLHFLLQALPDVLAVFPRTKVYVAGADVTGRGSWKKRLKISGYGRFLRKLMDRHGLWEHVRFLGRLDAEQMKGRYLSSSLFVCCSSIENSPNSLGEAMILGVPCVSADVGGIRSIFTDGRDGILYACSKMSEKSDNNGSNLIDGNDSLREISRNLSNAVIEIWSQPEKMLEYSRNARIHAEETHQREKNFRRMKEIYSEIASRDQSSEKSGEPDAGRTERNPRFVFVSNYINHHQIPFCNAMYERLAGDFAFIQTEPMEEERVRMGWRNQAVPSYVRHFYEEPENCRKLILDCPMVLFGGVDDESYIAERLESGKPVIRYSERLYKEGQWRAVSPRGLVKKYHDHARYRSKPVWLLCAGAYVPSDFHIIRAYPDKMLQWGYFPETRHYDVDKLMSGKRRGSILWAARFLDWKHPETALGCARHLKEKGIRFHLNIVGDGRERPLVDGLMEKYDLSDCVTLLGYQSPDRVRALMEESAIYLATSDRREGWGAVINEAMNSGCAVVADHMMGAAPCLIRQGENGMLYRDGRPERLCAVVEELLQDDELRERLGRAAVATIERTWNAEVAAERLLKFCESYEMAEEGPCSPAEVVSERKMLCKIL